MKLLLLILIIIAIVWFFYIHDKSPSETIITTNNTIKDEKIIITQDKLPPITPGEDTTEIQRPNYKKKFHNDTKTILPSDDTRTELVLITQEENTTEIQKPNYIPSLRSYDTTITDDIFRASNSQSYIIPEDAWVKYYASLLYIDERGIVRYKDSQEANAFEDNLFINDYFTDDELFNYPANADKWQNPDYYLTHNMKGDCEDFSIALTSMLLSGEMSVRINGEYIKQIIPAKTIFGFYLDEGRMIRHAWTEYTINEETYIAHSPGYAVNPIDNKKAWSITEYLNKSTITNPAQFSEKFEFTDKYFQEI